MSSLSHEGSFVSQVRERDYCVSSSCGLSMNPGDESYPEFLQFMTQNLERLSHAILVGTAFIGSRNAHDLLQRLTGFIRHQQRFLVRGEGWDREVGDVVELRGDGLRSVVRTEIYPSQGIDAVCYHVAIDGRRRDSASLAIVLERYLVSQQQTFSVVRGGSFVLDIATGALVIGLDDSRIVPIMGSGEADSRIEFDESVQVD